MSRNKLTLTLIFAIMILIAPALVDAVIYVTTNPATSFNIPANPFTVSVDVGDLGGGSNGVNVQINVTGSTIGIVNNNNSVVSLGNIGVGSWDILSYTWTLNGTAVGSYTVFINATDNAGNFANNTIVLNVTSNLAPNLVFNASNVSVQAGNTFSLPVSVRNNGSGTQPQFNISMRYNASRINFTGCSIAGCGNTSDTGSNRIAYYIVSSLAANATQSLNFNFNASYDPVTASYQETFYGDAYGKKTYPVITVSPQPTYLLNVTKIYNDSATITLNLSTQALNVAIDVRNIGNQNLTSVTLTAKANGTDFSSMPYSIGALNSYLSDSRSYTYTLPRPGTYNISVDLTGTNGANTATDYESKMFTIYFTFNDSDADGYYPVANGGTDCNDSNSTINPAATDIASNGIDEDCSGADYVPGTSSGGGGGGGGSSAGVTYSVAFTSDGTSQKLSAGDIVNLLFDGKSYSLKLTSIGSSNAVVVVGGINYGLKYGVPMTFDLDKNGVSDLSLTLTKLSSNAVQAAIKNLEVKKTEPTKPTTPGKTTGTGGKTGSTAAGSSGQSEEVKKEPKQITLSKDITKLSMAQGDIVLFKLRDEFHGITLKEVKKDSVVIVVASNPITFELALGESKEVDVDNSSTSDLGITLEDIENGEAQLTVKEIPEPLFAGKSVFSKNAILGYIVPAVFILAVIGLAGYIMLAKPKPKKRR